MTRAGEVSDEVLAEQIKGVIDALAFSTVVNLSSHVFDRIPCTARKLYAICKKHAAAWGYRYDGAEYRPSGNRPFERDHKRGQRISPRLRKI